MRLQMQFYALAKLVTSQRLGDNGWPDGTAERVW